MPLPQWSNPFMGAVYKSLSLSFFSGLSIERQFFLGQLNFEEEEIVRDGFKIVGDLANALKHYSSLTKPLVEQSYRDWVKVYDVIYQTATRLKPNPQSRACLYAEICMMVWSEELGNAFGYTRELQNRSARMGCDYDRCSGSNKVRGIEQLVCGECPQYRYCGIRCQQS